MTVTLNVDFKVTEMPSTEYCHPVWCGKTKMAGLPDGVNILRICITVYTQYRRVTDRLTDGQTDRQTSCHGILRAIHTRRAVKTEPQLH